jgi:Zn-dependent protease
MGFLGLNFNPVSFIGFMLGFVIGTTFHEFMHAYSALLLGDDLAKRQGRISLNPAMHFDPFGFFMGVLLALGVPALAWGRPVMVNPYALRGGRRGMAVVAIAGPLANLAFAAALIPLVKFGGLPTDVRAIVSGMIGINLLLFTFNLIPIPPLDGFNILSGILPNSWNMILEPIRQYSLPILLGMIFFVPYIGTIFGFRLNLLGEAIGPVQALLFRVFGLA